MQINRLFEIIYLLLDKRMITAAEFAEHFEVSVRTVYRDIETLSQVGIPVYATKGKGGGIRLTENFVLNKSVLTKDEQQKILQSLHGMNAVQTEEAEPVLSKLSALFGGDREDWIEIEFSAWNEQNPISQKFTALKEAICSHQKAVFVYSGANGITMKRKVEPMKLVFRANEWYLYAWCLLREDFRFFKLARIEELAVMEEYFDRRKMPELWKGDCRNKEHSKYADKMVEIIAFISKEKAYRIKDELPKEAVEQLENGNYKARFSMPDNDWMYQYLLSFGGDLEVVEPKEIRDNIKKELEKNIKQYLI